MFRAPSFVVFGQRKNASRSSRQSSPRTRGRGTTRSPRNPLAMDGLEGSHIGDGDAGDDGPSPHKIRSTVPKSGTDSYSVDTKLSGVSGESDSLQVSISPKHKDPDRIKKDREREERVRQARERLDEERKKKLVELQDQQRQAQENRERQLELRRKKIEDLRRRDIERRTAVEERRKAKEDAERSRRETLLIKAEERVARYEAWKRGGSKGPCPDGPIPTSKHLSVSTSVLYHKRHSDFSSVGMLNVNKRPDSLAALNTIPEGRRSFLAPSAPSAYRPKNVMTLSGSSSGSSSSPGVVKMREHKTPWRPRPASVGTSMPSFLVTDPGTRPSPRSKSTDRLARERSKTRVSVSAHQVDGKDGEKDEEKKTSGDKPRIKVSRHTLDRLSAPKQSPVSQPQAKDASVPKKESSVSKKSLPKEKTHKHSPSPAANVTIATASPATPATVTGTPTSSHTPTRALSPAPISAPDDDGGSASGHPTPVSAPAPAADITAEEYKARLAEKRRQARERAEKEAEEERKRLEELQRQEEERIRLEEEEQRRQEEEAIRMAEEARLAEDERLRSAIEAEEQRRAEEAARLEQERLAKEEADRRAKEEAERLEQERLEKARREEEERQERKKRLEMIMKRVKTDTADTPKESPSKSVTGSPTKSVASSQSSDNSPLDPEGKEVPGVGSQSSAVAEESDEILEIHRSGASTPPFSPARVIASSHERASQEDLSEKDQSEVSQTVQPFVSPATTSATIEAAENGSDKPRFRSPLLQKLVEGKEETSPSPGERPKFKSPLLQNLLGKTKTGARVSLDRQDHSVSTPDLSRLEHARNGGAGDSRDAASSSEAMSASMVDVGAVDSRSRKEVLNKREEKDVDTSEESSASSHSSPSHKSDILSGFVANGDSRGLSSVQEKSVSFADQHDLKTDHDIIEGIDTSFPANYFTISAPMATSAASLWSEQDSGASFGSDDFRPGASASPLQLSLNGHGSDPVLMPIQAGRDMEDSSISMRSAESVITSSIVDSATGSVFSSLSSLPHGQSSSGGGGGDFEELIDLSVNNKTSPSLPRTTFDNSGDLVDISEGSVPPPIIAFEESSTRRRSDVPDLLS